MRISDWSSDVCSSDLLRPHRRNRIAAVTSQAQALRKSLYRSGAARANGDRPFNTRGPRGKRRGCQERKSVEEGKSGSVRVDLGGRSIIKKKTTHIKHTKLYQSTTLSSTSVLMSLPLQLLNTNCTTV